MPEIVDLAAPLRRVTPGRGHFFFGYYDVPAADAAGRHLVHEVAFRDHYPTPTDLADIGWFALPASATDASPGITPLGTTLAWNFQQGAQLQWLASEPDACLYNTFEDGRFGAAVHNVVTGARRRLPLPVANVSRDGRQALAINLARVYDFRPGYGYEEAPDPFATVAAPDDDGIRVMALATGSHRQILSYRRLAAHLRQVGALTGERKVVVNHITFSPTARRFMFLLRTFVTEPGQPWLTFLLTADPDGSDLRWHEVWGMASHYHWTSDDELLVWAYTGPEKQGALVNINVVTGERTLLDERYFLADGHCSWSPDGRWVLYDSYPDGRTEDHLRWLAVYSVERRQGYTLGRFRSEPTSRMTPQGRDSSFVDLRCDLHPRWMPDGRSITFDSIHEGYRAVYWMDLRAIVD